MASLVKRKIGGLVGVIMNKIPDQERPNSFIYDVAFGYSTKSDATKNKKLDELWVQVHSDHLQIIGDNFL